MLSMEDLARAKRGEVIETSETVFVDLNEKE